VKVTKLSCQAYCHSLRCGHCTRFNNMFMCCVSLKWTCQIQIPPSVKCILLFDFLTRKEMLQLKFIVKLLVFMVMIWTGRMWQNGVMNLIQEERTFIMNKSWIKHSCWQVCDDQWNAWNDSWCVHIIGSWDREREVRLRKMLSENHKNNWMGAALTFLTLCSEEANEFLTP